MKKRKIMNIPVALRLALFIPSIDLLCLLLCSTHGSIPVWNWKCTSLQSSSMFAGNEQHGHFLTSLTVIFTF